MKVAGQWRYVYRAIDQFGQVIDVFVSPQRDGRATRRFFEQAIRTATITPAEVATVKAPTYPAVVEELLAAAHRTDRYANNHLPRESAFGLSSPHLSKRLGWPVVWQPVVWQPVPAGHP